MSTRPVLKPQAVISSGSMAGNVTSAPTILNQLSCFSYEASWSGTTPVGTLSVELSNTYSLASDGSVAAAGTWTPATLQYGGQPVTSIPVSGNTGSAFIDLTQTGGWAARLVYTRTSGTGTLQATVMGKVQ